ncbi:MAG: zf-HC2 domain-containing protein [Proteobacteria bacterium]|nr:zf-HC2 domain-containing protein [Pseudomonadota bacterium]
MNFKFTCDQIAQLVSDSQDRELGKLERLSLVLHMKMCDVCNEYQKQLNLLKTFSKSLSLFSEKDAKRTISQDSKKLIKDKLNSFGNS